MTKNKLDVTNKQKFSFVAQGQYESVDLFIFFNWEKQIPRLKFLLFQISKYVCIYIYIYFF